MKILRDPRQAGPCVLVLGTFDGVHRGHQALLMAGNELAERYHLPLTAVVDPDFMLRRIRALGESLDTAVPERVGWCAVRHLGNAFFADAWFNTPM